MVLSTTWNAPRVNQEFPRTANVAMVWPASKACHLTGITGLMGSSPGIKSRFRHTPSLNPIHHYRDKKGDTSQMTLA